MKKNYFLTGALVLASTFTFAQQEKMVGKIMNTKYAPVSADELKMNASENFNKAEGDTLFYEDFGTGFSTNGWVALDASSNGFDWIYTTAAPGGQYSSTIPVISSTTAANGFASMRADFYNTPTPGGGFLNMDGYLTSGPIVIAPKSNLLLRWQQSYRYCCNATSASMEVQVSSDNMNWSNFTAKPNVAPNTLTNQSIQVNISSVAANQDTIYIRFYTNASHYFWMLDDIAVVEGASNQLELTKAFSSFGPIDREGFFTMVPGPLTQPLTFGGIIKNDGGSNASNTKLKVNVTKGSTVVYSDSVNAVATLAPQMSDTVNIVTPYGNTDGSGDYKMNYSAVANAASSDMSRTVRSIDFTITDTILGKDYNLSGGSVGPGSYVDGDAAGSRIGTRYNLGAPAELTSVSYFISTSSLNTGAEIKSKVWGFDTSQASLNDAMNVPGIKAQNPIPYIIQASDLGTWVTFKMLPSQMLPVGHYVAVAEQSNANTAAIDFTLGRSNSSEDLQPNADNSNLSTFIYVAGAAAPSWGWITSLPMIRMNFGKLPIGINETKEAINSFVVSPNPSNGQFKVEVIAENARFNLSVRNMIGQVVYNENISVSNSLTKSIDLSNLDKGIYFVSLENGVNREVQKVIIK
jgi:hypothetical protein